MASGLTQRRVGELPVEITGFVGRRSELAKLSTLLRTARLVTVTGPGGQVVTSRRFTQDRHQARCGAEPLRKTIKLSYVVPAGARGPLMLTAMSVGMGGRVGRATITFKVGS